MKSLQMSAPTPQYWPILADTVAPSTNLPQFLLKGRLFGRNGEKAQG